MKLLTNPLFSRFFYCVSILIVLLSCQFLTSADKNPSPVTPGIQNPSPTTVPSDQNSAEATPEPPAQSSSDVEELIAGPDPLDYLLNLRSVIIRLNSQQPDGSGSSLQIEIDSAGNMHEVGSLPPFSKENLAQGMEMPTAPESYEIFVVDGKAYASLEQNRNWMSTPVAEDYIAQLSATLHTADGLALWLDLLPSGSLISAGQETVGGFATNKYTVKGLVDGQSITGNLWYEQQTGALVKAELTVPSVLYDGSANGQFKIDLDTQKSKVAPITLPKKPD